MQIDRRIAFPLVGLAAITLFGAMGYVLIEGWSLVDALYMSVITVSTVGFGEVQALSPAGRIFTVVLIIFGVGAVFYLISILAEGFLEGQFRQIFQRSAMQRTIARLEGHVIVCGYGRLGRVVVEEITQAGKAVVVIDEDPGLEAELGASGHPFVLGSAASDDILVAAHITSAAALVVATSSEADGVFITLAARELNPGLRVYARGESEAGVRRLQRAGADQVTSPFQMGGARVAASILRPSVVDFLELSTERHDQSIDLEEIRVESGCELVGRSVGDIEARFGEVRIVALKDPSGQLAFVSGPGGEIEAGGHIVLVGQRSALEKLARAASGQKAS